MTRPGVERRGRKRSRSRKVVPAALRDVVGKREIRIFPMTKELYGEITADYNDMTYAKTAQEVDAKRK